MTNNLDLAKQKVLEENTAQAVFKNLKRLENERDRFRTRWAWELLQNARDSADEAGVEIAFVKQEGMLIFKHTGQPFTEDNIVHLIYHGSSKVDENDPVGQFGTGFISTHLISKTVQVRGFLDLAECFNFMLDRRGASPKDLQASMEGSWSAFKESIQPISNNKSSFSTEYTYELESNAVNEMVCEGLDEVRRNVGFILALNENLRAIHLENHGKNNVFRKIGLGEEGMHCNYIQIEERDSDNEIIDVIEVGVASDADVTVAIPLNNNEDARALSSIEGIPRLYVAFPLLGTDEFTLPCVVNSIQFEPTEDRDGVFLASGDSEDNARNRALLLKGLELTAKLLTAAETDKWQDGYRLGELGDISSEKWLDDVWYRESLISNLLPVIRQAAILPSVGGDLIQPIKAWIPIGKNDVTPVEVWKLAAGLKEGKQRLPVESEIEQWATNLTGWSLLCNKNTGDMDESLGVERLTKYIADLESIDQLNNALEDEVDSIEWLNELYRILFTSDLTDLFDNHAILLNQMGRFRSRSQLKIDRKSHNLTNEFIDNKLKDISEGLNSNVRHRLLDNRINTALFADLLPALYQEDVVNELTNLVREQGDKKHVSEHELKSNVSLFAWAIDKQVWKVIDSYPVTTRATKDNVITWQILSRASGKQDDRLLAPPAQWPEITREYADLFPDRYIISDIYSSFCNNPEDWGRLAEHGYILTGPIFNTKQKIRDFLPDEPLPEAEDEESRQSIEPVEVSNIAFLRKNEIGILHTIRNSKRKALRFLEFLIYAVLENDQTALDTADVSCENGEAHTYFKANWLGPVKQRKWVPLGERKTGLINHESLGLLIKDVPEFMAALTEGKPALLMQALGVSLSALSLQALSDDEDDRVALIKSLASITESAGGDIAKIEELANDFKEDPDLLNKLEESREKRKRIKENQKVGGLVEELFKELLEGKGFVVERTGIGSDYSIESDIVDNGEEIGLSIQDENTQYFVEIKSTKGDAARISYKQMETAVEKDDSFVVCYVCLSDSTPDREWVENNSRFIFHIGGMVKELWSQLTELLSAKTACDAHATRGDLTLEVDELGARLRIGKATWEEGKTLAEAIDYFTA